MIKKIFIGFAFLSILAINIISISRADDTNSATIMALMHNATANAEEDCSDPTMPNMNCPIWDVTVEVSVPPSFSCTTGGSYVCALVW